MTRPEAARRPLVLIFVIALIGVAATALFVVMAATPHFTIGADGTAREVPLSERVSDEPVGLLFPLAIGASASVAAAGLFMRQRYASYPAVGVGAAIALLGGFLLYQAAREWALPGSFAALILPPAVVCLAVGAYVVIAALRVRQRLA